jgi:glycerol-3-phosphate dehydrogenase
MLISQSINEMPEYGMETSSFAHQARVQNATAGDLMVTGFGTQGLLLQNY